MPLSLLNHSALALFAQRTRIPTSARSIGFCAIWVCISSSSSSMKQSTKKNRTIKHSYWDGREEGSCTCYFGLAGINYLYFQPCPLRRHGIFL